MSVVAAEPADLARAPGPAHADALAALRAQGADQSDPLRFSHIEALARRASAHTGATRQLLDQRLEQLTAEMAQRAEAARPLVGAGDTAPAVRRPTLADLLTHINGATRLPSAPAASSTAPEQRHARTGADRVAMATAPELKAISHYRSTWARLGAERRLKQALDKVPDNAGPLNTPRLLHEALLVMRDASPAYLQNFMAQVEALLWLEQVSQPPAPAADKKPGARKTRG